MAARYDDITFLLLDLDINLSSLLSIALRAKADTIALLADPDFSTALTADEKAYVTAIDAVLTSTPTDYARLTYELTVTAGTNGTVTPTGSVIVQYGNDQLFTATPDMGYAVNVWKVDGATVQTGGLTYLLESVFSDATVGVTFV
jgi:hypothetical protein